MLRRFVGLPITWATIVFFAATPGCQRSDFDSQIAVRVIELTTYTAEDGTVVEGQSPVPNAKVYIVRAGEGFNALGPNSYNVQTDAAGNTIAGNLEGYYDVAVDGNDDLIIDALRRNVASGSSIAIVLNSTASRPTEPTDGVVLPPTSSSITMNGGATETTSYFVLVDVVATNAATLTLSESTDKPGATRAYQPAFGHQLSTGQGKKTLYAMAYNVEGKFAGPVSASIVVKMQPPYPPVLPLLWVQTNAPGNDDFLSGLAGSVEAGNRVRIYSDSAQTVLLAEGISRSDGSFGPLNIKDGSVPGNVDLGDLVYVTNVDIFDRESAPVWVENDSTPPEMGTLDGYWQPLYFPFNVGTAGEIFYATFSPIDANNAADIAGGILHFPPFGPGAPDVPIPANPPSLFTAEYKIPDDLLLDAVGQVSATLWDAAYNSVTGVSMIDIFPKYFFLNSAPPFPVTMDIVRGGNRELDLLWTDPNYDGAAFDLRITNELGEVVHSDYIPVSEYYCTVGRAPANASSFLPPIDCTGIPEPATPPVWRIKGLQTCQWYSVSIAVVDYGNNRSAFSDPVSAEVILPPPLFSAWGGVADPSSGFGTIFYSMGPVLNASGYELGVSTASGAPYAYTAPSGFSSPVSFASLPVGYKTPRVTGIPPGYDYYLSSRAFDGECASHYAPEVSADTSLRLYSYSDGVTDTRRGGALALMSDQNGDSIRDVIIGSSGARTADVITAGTGQTLQGLGSFFSPFDYNMPGSPIASIDIDGDGVDEVLIGSPLETRNGYFLAGEVRLVDAAGNVLKTFAGNAEGLQYGYTVARLGDITGDGISEFAITGLGCAHLDCMWTLSGPIEGPGRVDIYDGATQTIIHTHVGQAGDLLGASIAAGFDYDGNGYPDYVLGAPGAAGQPSAAYALIVSPNSMIQWKILTPFSSSRFATSLTVATLNGFPYVFVGSVGSDVVSPGFVSAYYYIDQNWVPGWQKTDAFAGSGFGASIAIAPSVSKDGTPDLLVGAPGQLQSFSYGAGSAYVFDAYSGKLHYEVRGEGYDGGVGYAILPLDDLNGKEKTEWMVSAPGSAHSGYESGRVYIFTTDP